MKNLIIGGYYKLGWEDDLLIAVVLSIDPEDDNEHEFKDIVILEGDSKVMGWTSNPKDFDTIVYLGMGLDDFPEYFL